MLCDPSEIDPFDCQECVALATICPYHRGWADGWDQAAQLVGEYVTGTVGDT
jgi:hypothetical protein